MSEAIASEVVVLVLEWERLDCRVALLVSQLQTQIQREAVMEAAYRTGAGSTTSMLSVWQRTEDLEGRSLEIKIDQNQTRQELEGVVYGFSIPAEATGRDTNFDSGGNWQSHAEGDRES